MRMVSKKLNIMVTSCAPSVTSGSATNFAMHDYWTQGPFGIIMIGLDLWMT